MKIGCCMQEREKRDGGSRERESSRERVKKRKREGENGVHGKEKKKGGEMGL